MILLHDQLRLKYQNLSDAAAPLVRQINETEQLFWKQLKQVVQQNLDNSAFSVQDFVKAMFMSSMPLYKGEAIFWLIKEIIKRILT